MADIYVGLAVMLAVSVVAFLMMNAGLRKSGRLTRGLLLAVSASAFAGYFCFLWQNPVLAEWLPFSNLIIVGNWALILVSLLAAFVLKMVPGSNYRRSFWTVALIGTGLLATVYPLLGESPTCGDHSRRDGFCFQTTERTCAPACAASLLRRCGLQATEAEMARHCLTRAGTTWMGLYRGLKLKTQGTPWSVEVVTGSIEQLRRDFRDPMIIIVGLDRAAGVDPDFQREEGWRPGVGHAVMLLGFRNDESVEICDPSPSIGNDYWTMDELRLLWRGRALRLVKR